jgi:hypothetical protein
MEILTKKLSELKLNEDIISICLKKIDWDKIKTGKVLTVNSKFITFVNVSKYGKFLQKEKINITEIASVENGGDYYNLLKILVKSTKGKGVYTKGKYIYFSSSKGCNINKINEIILSQEIVTIFCEDNYSIGLIKNIEFDIVTIGNVTHSGEKNGTTLIYIKSISKIRMLSSIENKASLLFSFLYNPDLPGCAVND